MLIWQACSRASRPSMATVLEFVQTVEEVLSSLEPVIEKHPEYEKVDLLGRMVGSRAYVHLPRCVVR